MARHRLIACEVFFREFCAVLADTPHVADVEFVEQGLHGRQSCSMAAELQRRVAACDDGSYHAILLGYGLCNNGIAGLRTRRTPLVVPRAHDCITLFLGGRQRYDRVFKDNPGTYYLTSGWIERARRSIETLPTNRAGAGAQVSVYAEYVEKFGEENAKYLLETMGAWKGNYARMVFINVGVGDVEAHRAYVRDEAETRGLKFKELDGDLRLFRGLVNGPPWDEDEYLVVPPGREIRPTYDAAVIEAREPVAEKARS